MKRLMILSTALAVIMTSCYKEPVANFTYSPSDPLVGEKISFQNLSYDAESFQWDFDDGTGSPSYSPEHIFTVPGTYNVTLTAFGKRSGVDEHIVPVTVAAPAPTADFGYSHSVALVGQDISFSNLSQDAVAVVWDFGDGSISIEENPKHAFTSVGSYTVTMTAVGAGGLEDEISAVISVVLLDFYATTDLPGDQGDVAVETDVVFIGEAVKFNNLAGEDNDYVWEFGDGYTSENVSPGYSYDTPGTYTVTLTAYDGETELDSWSKIIDVYEGVNSAVRITVLEYYDEYAVEGASVILYPTVDDWVNETNGVGEEFTTPLGKCVFENLNQQNFYVDVWEQDHDNYMLAEESVDWIETQVLEAGYIHDFIAYVDYYAPGKKTVLTRVGKKKLAKELISQKDPSEFRQMKKNQFSSAK